jgi:hypothetical protein
MNKPLKVLLDLPEVKVKVHPGTNLVLQLLLQSQIAESWLFRPAIDDWVVDNGQILTMASHIDPSFVQLTCGKKVNQTVTIFIPSVLQPGKFLKSWLRFPAIAEESIPIEVEISSLEQEQDKHQVVEVCLSVTLPFNLEKNSLSSALEPTTAGTFGLMSGLIDLDKIPSRWLVAELLVILCQRGNEYVQTEPGKELLNQLKTTRLFQNGVSAFASAQIPIWIGNSLKSMKTILGGESLLSVWEQWLFSLVGADIQKVEQTSVSPVSAETILSKIGEAADCTKRSAASGDRWFAGIVLGLAHSSLRIATTLSEIASTEVCDSTQGISISTQNSVSATGATHSLITKLPSLDLLPARWLVVELLLLLCKKGDEYAQTQAGSQLLAQLRNTRFFKNGVIAFTCAQVPRWLAISHEAAEAYQTSASPQIGQGGLLEVGEEWLWSLQASDIPHFSPELENLSPNLSPARREALNFSPEPHRERGWGVRHDVTSHSDIPVPDAAVDTLLASLGMNPERWFSCVVLGLALVSPRIADTWCAIARVATTQGDTSLVSPTAFEETILDSVFPERGSLQR